MIAKNSRELLKLATKIARINNIIVVRMRRDLKTLFKDMYKENSEKIKDSKKIINTDIYKNDMSNLLNKYYNQTADHFKNTIRNDPYLKNIPKNLAELVNKNIENYIKETQEKQTKIILDTTQEDIEQTTKKIIAISILKNISPTKDELANSSQKYLNARVNAKADVIANYEIPNIASETQNIEANTLIVAGTQTVSGVALPCILGKTWVTMGDERVRHEKYDHVSADGQTVGALEDFIVSGELLSRPRDSSRASVGNFINCRCEVVNVVKTPKYFSPDPKGKTIEPSQQNVAKINQKNSHGWTQLMTAVGKNRTEEIKNLISLGADLDITEHWGKTALFLGALSGNADVVQLLVDAGANTKIKDKHGRIAINEAEAMVKIGSTKHQKIIDILKK